LDVAQQKTSLYKVQHPAHYFENSGSYVLALVVKNTEGCSDTTVKSIRVEDDFLVFVPNAFTPNSDGRNECFLPVLRGQKFFGMQIYDRWGHEIFSMTELAKGWDGTHKGNACPEGVYTWKLSIAAKSGVQKILTGAVTLYR
jgi:gliding motility-associated-like protein